MELANLADWCLIVSLTLCFVFLIMNRSKFSSNKFVGMNEAKPHCRLMKLYGKISLIHHIASGISVRSLLVDDIRNNSPAPKWESLVVTFPYFCFLLSLHFIPWNSNFKAVSDTNEERKSIFSKGLINWCNMILLTLRSRDFQCHLVLISATSLPFVIWENRFPVSGECNF